MQSKYDTQNPSLNSCALYPEAVGLTEASWCAVNAYPGLYCAAAAGSSDCAPRLHSSAGTLPRSASAARVDTHSQVNSMPWRGLKKKMLSIFVDM